MKEMTSIVLVGILTLVLMLSSAVMVYSSTSEMDECYDNYERCNERALSGKYGVVKTTLFLTACDLALITCTIAINL